MSKGLIILLGLTLLAILGYFCIYQHRTEIQNDVQTRTVASLAIEGLKDINVSIDGRDVALTGKVASNKIRKRAGKLVKNVYGVRTVNNRLVVVIPKSDPDEEVIEQPEPMTTSEEPPIIEEPPTVEELPIIEEPSTVEELPIEQPETVLATPKLEPLPEYTCQQDFDLLLSTNKIHFATNSAEIETSSYNLLNDLVEVTKQCPDAEIEIGGHTDSRGKDEYNLRLSQERASAVLSYLVSKGIDSSQLTAVGYGESQPIADNETEEGLAKNRRIEFKVKGLQP